MNRRNFLQLLGVSLIVPTIANAQPRVVLYGTSWCPYCKAARRLFMRHHIKFEDYDIEKDRNAANQFQRLGGQGVPLIIIGDDIVSGFDEQQLKQLLNIQE